MRRCGCVKLLNIGSVSTRSSLIGALVTFSMQVIGCSANISLVASISCGCSTL